MDDPERPSKRLVEQRLPLKDMKRLLADVTVASTPFDMATWFDLKTALGG